MVITKREDVTKQGFCKTLWRKLRLRASLLLVLIPFWGVVGVRGWVPISVWVGVGGGWGRGGRLFEAGRLLTFSSFRMGAYSRWALIRGWALIRINTVYEFYRVRDWVYAPFGAKTQSHSVIWALEDWLWQWWLEVQFLLILLARKREILWPFLQKRKLCTSSMTNKNHA